MFGTSSALFSYVDHKKVLRQYNLLVCFAFRITNTINAFYLSYSYINGHNGKLVGQTVNVLSESFSEIDKTADYGFD